jgi:hypothetical protein
MANNVLLLGFQDLASVMGDRITQVGVQRVMRAVEQAVAEYNRQADALLALLARRVTDAKRNYLLPGSGTLQPLDEQGIPVPVQEGGSYDVAWPIAGGGTAFGQNRITRRLMTVEEVQRHVLESQRRDADWLIRHALAAIFDNAAYTFTDKLLGALTVQPLANGDSVAYLRRGGAISADNHFLAKASIDAALMSDIHSELIEHPGNGDTTVVFAPTASLSTITGLTGFVELDDPAIALGANSNRVRGVADRLLGPGTRVVGKMRGGAWIVEWPRVPDNYLIGVAIDAGDPPLAMREYPDPALQGLFSEQISPDGVGLQINFIRYAGFGALNRVAAVAVRTNNAAYAIPAGFDAPLAV